MAIFRKKQKVDLISVFAPVVIILAVILGTLFLLKGAPNHQDSAVEHAELVTGKKLPDIEMTKMDGSHIYLSDVKSKVIMLTFWATWCDACMVEMPSIVSLWKKYKDRGFEVLAVNLDENPDVAVPQAMKSLGMGFPIFKDPDGKVADVFEIQAIPLTVIVDQNRKILFVLNGERDWSSKAVYLQIERWLAQ